MANSNSDNGAKGKPATLAPIAGVETTLLKAPKDHHAASVDGQNYQVVDGHVRVIPKHAAALIDVGYTIAAEPAE